METWLLSADKMPGTIHLQEEWTSEGVDYNNIRYTKILSIIAEQHQTIKTVRNAHHATPALPPTRQDLVIPEVYKWSHLKWESRMLIFAKQRSLNALWSWEHWYMDLQNSSPNIYPIIHHSGDDGQPIHSTGMGTDAWQNGGKLQLQNSD